MKPDPWVVERWTDAGGWRVVAECDEEMVAMVYEQYVRTLAEGAVRIRTPEGLVARSHDTTQLRLRLDE